jgi:prepilin-type N-terminal cleavage/methylation domain-containing protein
MNTTIPTARRRGLSLVELLLGLAVLAIVSVGATNMIIGGLRVDRAMLDANRQVSEMELAVRRMTRNIRTGTILSLTGTTSFTLASQPDSTKVGATYTVTYSYDSAAQTLSEASTQYGSPAPVNVIAYNVTTFSVSKVSDDPVVLQLDIAIGSRNSAATRRTFRVLNRNS